MSVESINARLATTIAPYEAQKRTTEAQFNQTANELKTTQDDNQRKAYLVRRDSERTLPQLMAAAGKHGGITETSGADIVNNYQNIRYGHDRDYTNNYAKAKLERDNSIASIDAMIAAARAQAEADIADELAAEAAAASRYSGGRSYYRSSGVDTTPSPWPTGNSDISNWYDNTGWAAALSLRSVAAR